MDSETIVVEGFDLLEDHRFGSAIEVEMVAEAALGAEDSGDARVVINSVTGTDCTVCGWGSLLAPVKMPVGKSSAYSSGSENSAVFAWRRVSLAREDPPGVPVQVSSEGQSTSVYGNLLMRESDF